MSSTDDFNRPIIILTIPRSGSSMTAGIFALHGVWTGPVKAPNEYNPKGYFESSLYLQRVVKYLKLVTYPKINATNTGWKQEVRDMLNIGGYTTGPYLFKHSARHFALWNDFNPYFVCVRRKMESIKRSKKRINRKGDIHIAIRKDVEAMQYIDQHVRHVNVYTDQVVDGDLSSLENAFDYCNLHFDPKVALDFIDPSLWHHR